jgi:hypothetical protein
VTIQTILDALVHFHRHLIAAAGIIHSITFSRKPCA